MAIPLMYGEALKLLELFFCEVALGLYGVPEPAKVGRQIVLNEQAPGVDVSFNLSLQPFELHSLSQDWIPLFNTKDSRKNI